MKPIPKEYHQAIHDLDVNKHKVTWDLNSWTNLGPSAEGLIKHLAMASEHLGRSFGREDLVRFYRNDSVPLQTKLIAAMVWGHEAPAGSRRDSRGPWKLGQMFADWDCASRLVEQISVSSYDQISRSYELFRQMPRCGANFFTKHFHFLGKAASGERYPVIFDDRVARGLMKLQIAGGVLPSCVSVSTSRKPAAYIEYLRYVHDQAEQSRSVAHRIKSSTSFSTSSTIPTNAR